MAGTTRLAVLETGEPAVRVLAAVGNLNRRTPGTSITTVLVHDVQDRQPWYAREADESLRVGDGTPEELVASLVAAGIQMVWPGGADGPWLVAFVAACEAAGLSVVGPASATLKVLDDRDRLVEAARSAGLELLPEGRGVDDLRVIEADVLMDGATTWSLGLREVTIVCPTGALVLAEQPAPFLDGAVEAQLTAGAASLLGGVEYVGAAVVRFLVEGSGDRWWLDSVDTLARPEHALTEESTGASFVGLRLRIALGGRLDPEAPRPDGWAVEVRLLAHDPERGHAPSSGPLVMLDLPVGTGVRADASLREGDPVDGAVDPVLATVCAWGRDRGEAFRRLQRALERTTVVLGNGMSNRAAMLALLDRPELREGPVQRGWYPALDAADELRPEPDPVALLAAAVEAYESDLAQVRAEFFASARRGRPENPDAVGARVHLEYRGSRYRLRVDRTGPDSYHVRDGDRVDLVVDRLGEFERRITCGGRKRRVVAIAQEAVFRIEVDGVAHLVTRVDGASVRAAWPALVSSILVEPGQEVVEGEPVAVLESMKMVSTVTAPFAGTVITVDVVSNAQVERGAPLLHLRHPGTVPGPSSSGGERVDLAGLGHDPTGVEPGAEDLYGRLTDYLLGYDLDPIEVRALAAGQRALSSGTNPGDPTLLATEDAFLDLFTEMGSLYRPRTETDQSYALSQVMPNTQEYVLSFLQWLDADRAGLPDRYRSRLEHALRRYGVAGLERSEALEQAMLWLFRCFTRVPAVAPYVATILERRLAHVAALGPVADAESRQRLERLAAAAEGRQQHLADQARDLIFRCFDEPVLSRVTREVTEEMAEHLEALQADPHRPDRADRMDRLVWCPQPMRGMLLGGWQRSLEHSQGADADAFRFSLLEVYARRFYRIRELHGLDHVAGSSQLVYADYEHEDLAIHLVVGYTPLEDLPAMAEAIAGHLSGRDPAREVVVDLVAWSRDAGPPIEQRSEQVQDLLKRCDFGAPLHRLDLTITSLAGDQPERDRTQHLTFRSDGAGQLVEDTLYRNLHPMLGKRLDLWRLSNFRLERLASPEDVYLFHGIAHDNPRDHRLFALAEVRDLVRVQRAESGADQLSATRPDRAGGAGRDARRARPVPGA